MDVFFSLRHAIRSPTLAAKAVVRASSAAIRSASSNLAPIMAPATPPIAAPSAAPNAAPPFRLPIKAPATPPSNRPSAAPVSCCDSVVWQPEVSNRNETMAIPIIDARINLTMKPDSQFSYFSPILFHHRLLPVYVNYSPRIATRTLPGHFRFSLSRRAARVSSWVTGQGSGRISQSPK